MKPVPPVPCLVVDSENDDFKALDSSGLAHLASANREDTPFLVGKGECHTVCQKLNCIFDGE